MLWVENFVFAVGTGTAEGLCGSNFPKYERKRPSISISIS
jgi:hypothetical protein